MLGKTVLAVLAALGLLASAAVVTGATPPERRSYIVVLQPGTPAAGAVAAELARSHGGQLGFVYEHALQGFSITTTPQGAAGIARNPNVAFVETDDEVTIAAQTEPTGIHRIFADANTNIDIDATDDLRVDVDVAVIDTGVDFQHPELNVVGGITCSDSGPRFNRTTTCVSGGDDDHYHGTHVAGTIAAIDNATGVVGVAPGARIWAVKVLSSSGSGSESMVVAGIDWVAANAGTIEVANMSLGGSGYSRAEETAIQGAVDHGVAFAVAAGNSDADAKNYSPAAFPNVMTVSALADFDGTPGGLGSPTCRTDQDDTLADFSNWGTVVDIAAPGACILSTYPLERGEYGTISGTSMASPHVAGALAVLASSSRATNASGVHALYDQVKSAGNLNWTDDSGDGVQERLLDVSGFAAPRTTGTDSGGGDTPSDTVPRVSIDSPADGTSVNSGTVITFEGTASDEEDGTISGSIAWTSSLQGALGTGASTSATLTMVGSHTITASVTDRDGNRTSSTVTVQVTESSAASITLSATAKKVKGEKYADLAWSTGGTTASNVTIFRDGSAVITMQTSAGAHTDGSLGKGGGSATYQICEADTTPVCSNRATVTW